MPESILILSQAIGIVIQCATLIGLVYGFYKFTRKPSENLAARIDALEIWQRQTDARLHDGSIKFRSNAVGNKVTQNALIAIMDALKEIDGVPQRNKDELDKRRNDLWSFLQER